MDSDEVKVTFRNVSWKAENSSSGMNEVLSDLNKLNLLNEKCNDAEDKLNYNDGREGNAFDKMSNYYGRHKDIFLFNKLLRDKEVRVKIDELLRVKDDELKKRFFTRMQIYLKRLEEGEQEANGFLGGPVKQAFFTGPLGHQKQNLNLNLGKDGSLSMGTIFDGNLKDDEIKRLKVHANGSKLMTVLKNERGQKNYSFTKASSCIMQIRWLALSSQNCVVTLKIEGGKTKVTQSMINGEYVKLEELVPLAKQNKGLLMRDKRLEQLLQGCLNKGNFCEMKPELGMEMLCVTQLPQPKNKDSEVEQLFAEVANLMDGYKKDGVKDPLGKLRSHYGRNNNNVFLLKSVLTDELLREGMLTLIQDKLGADDQDTREKLERKLEKIANKFFLGENLAKKILVQFEHMEGFVGGRDSGLENLNLNLFTEGGIVGVIGHKAQVEGLRRVKVFGHGQHLLTITTNGKGKLNYKFCELGDCKWEAKVSWEAGGDSEGELKTCQLTLHINSAISFSTCYVNGQPVHPTTISELAKENKRMFLNGKSVYLVLEKILEEGGEPIPIKSIGSQEKLTFHSSISSGEDETDEASLKMGKDRLLLQYLENPVFNSKEEVNQFDLLAKYYGRQVGEDPFLFKGIIENSQLRQELVQAVLSKCGEEQVKKFVKRMEVYLDRIESGKRDANLFLGDDIKKVGDAFFHGHHVPHPPQHKANVHENLNVSLRNWPTPIFESGDKLFCKMIPRMWEEQSELRRVKVYGKGARLVDIHKLEGGKRNYTFHPHPDPLHSHVEMEMQIDWVAKLNAKKEEPETVHVDCTLLLNIKQGKIKMSKALINQTQVDTKEMIELVKQNKIVSVDGKSLAYIFEDEGKVGEHAGADPHDDDKWEVLAVADSDDN